MRTNSIKIKKDRAGLAPFRNFGGWIQVKGLMLNHPLKLRFLTGFTLAELMISVLIFSMMMTALVTIYGTINKHMFQSYRQNIVKNNLSIAVKAIQIRLMTATRVDIPAFNARGNVLAFVTNVDKQSGCSPINQDIKNPGGSVKNEWHYFCRAACPHPDEATPCLYYHTGPVPFDTGGCPCASDDTNQWTGSYPVGVCGPNGGGTVTSVLHNVQISSMERFFSRRFNQSTKEKINEEDQVQISLRTTSNIQGARRIDTTLGAIVHTQTTP
ncbi:MAG: hypothetical protein KAR84_02905 [Elusimicrobiales bacterium]|nr:hypothetical protein [Elusimicrobiales bacterium]